jgi:hypothetical protein
MHRFSRLHKIFWRALFTKISLLFSIVSFCMLLTAFASAILVMDYDWSMLMAASVCLLPWLIAIIALYVSLLICHTHYEQEKEDLINSGRSALISKFIMFLIQLIISKRNKSEI